MASIQDLKREMAAARVAAENKSARDRAAQEKRENEAARRIERVRELATTTLEPALKSMFADENARIQLHQECEEALNEHARRPACTVKALVSATFLHPRHAKDNWAADNVRVGFGYHKDDIVCFVKTSHAYPEKVTVVMAADPDRVIMTLQAHEIDRFTRETADAMLSGVVEVLLGKHQVTLVTKEIR